MMEGMESEMRKSLSSWRLPILSREGGRGGVEKKGAQERRG